MRLKTFIERVSAAMFLLTAACSEPKAQPIVFAAPEPLDVKRGIGFWPTDYSPDFIDRAFFILVQGAEIAVVQKWDPFDTPENEAVNNLFDQWLDRAGRAGLQKCVALEPFSDDRKALRLPKDWRGPAPNLTNPAWQAAYKEKVIEEARRHQPAYFNVAVEANMFYQYRPAEWKAFRSLMQSLRSAVKAVSPQTAVFCSYQYEVLQGVFAGGSTPAQWELLAEKAPAQDLLAISTYPLFLNPPYDAARLPADYFEPLASRSSLPIFIAEIGWYSSDSVDPPSSLENQAAFIARLPELCSGKNIEAVCWISLCDLKRLASLKQLEQSLPQFFSLALHDDQLTPKPAWDVWKALRPPAQQGTQP